MAGTWLDSETTVTPNNYVRVRNMRAYEDGVQAAWDNQPLASDPHPLGTPESLLWIEGHQAAVNDTVDESSSYRGQSVIDPG